MAKEIERKFLVKNNDYRELANPELYVQGYISNSPERTVRVRIQGVKAKLTIKGKNIGITRDEFEYDIPVSDARELLDNFCLEHIIEKFRYKINYDNHIWEIDEFIGDNEGLVIAEIEVKKVGEDVKIPEWIGAEVSGDPRYYNSNISQNPFKKWSYRE